MNGKIHDWILSGCVSCKVVASNVIKELGFDNKLSLKGEKFKFGIKSLFEMQI